MHYVYTCVKPYVLCHIDQVIQASNLQLSLCLVVFSELTVTNYFSVLRNDLNMGELVKVSALVIIGLCLILMLLLSFRPISVLTVRVESPKFAPNQITYEQKIDENLLVYNRVSKAGSEMFVQLLKKLSQVRFPTVKWGVSLNLSGGI